MEKVEARKKLKKERNSNGLVLLASFGRFVSSVSFGIVLVPILFGVLASAGEEGQLEL